MTSECKRDVATASISTHTPREGRDFFQVSHHLLLLRISTHTPREGRDTDMLHRVYQHTMEFQPTRPARGVTYAPGITPTIGAISTHTPREGRDGHERYHHGGHSISTHTPREGRDTNLGLFHTIQFEFQPTRPARGVTLYTTARRVAVAFQPTRPARGVTAFCRPFQARSIFQPTRPARGVTAPVCHGITALLISTHTPREGRDA